MNPVLREVLLITLFNVAALCCMVGIVLTIAPQRFLSATTRFNRWISTEEVFARLDQPRSVDRLLYRRHLWVGALLLLGGLYIVYVFWVWYDRARVLPVLPVIYSVPASQWVYDSLVTFLRGAGVVGVLAGVVVMMRPSLLKVIETHGNRWISTEGLTRKLDRQKELPQAWFPGHARWFGVGIVGGSFYIMLRCANALWGIG